MKFMKPLVKYQGGKSRELKIIKELMPREYNRIVEPFCGGAAVSFNFEKPAVLCDTNFDIINLYQAVGDNKGMMRLCHEMRRLREFEHDQLEQRFYDSRDEINRDFDPDNTTKWSRALSYMSVRQLCFSGMERYNSSGKFNVPFGHYKKFASNLTFDNGGNYWMMLRSSILLHGDFQLALNEVKEEDDFVFVDPPYLDRLGYHDGDGSDGVHSRLAKILKNAPYKWMIVHSDHPFYREQYKDFNIYVKDFVYAQRFGKNKNHSNAKVEHLYITNYPVPELAHPSILDHLDAV